MFIETWLKVRRKKKGASGRGAGVERVFGKRWYRLAHPFVNADGENQLRQGE